MYNNGLENESLGRCSVLVFFNKKDKKMKPIAEEIRELELVTNAVELVLDIDRLNLLLQVENNEKFSLKNLQNETLYVGKSFNAIRAYVDGYEAGLKAAK